MQIPTQTDARCLTRSNGQAHATLGPRMSTLVASCALVLTARALGVTWLEQHVLGVPSGLWAVGLTMLIAQYRHQRRLESMEGASGGLLSTRLTVPQISLAKFRAQFPTTDQVTGVMELLGVPSASWTFAKNKLHDIGMKIAPQAAANSGTIRIGIDLCDSDAESLIAAGRSEVQSLGLVGTIEWVRSRSGLISDVERDLSAERLDALVRRERRGDINVFMPEHPIRPAAWYDWSAAMPLGYAAVFPPRVDSARVGVAPAPLNEPSTAATLAQLILAGAMLGRTAARVGPGRKLLGRAEMPELSSPGGPLDRLMLRMGTSVQMDNTSVSSSSDARSRGLIQTAARVVGVWLTQSACACDETDRLRLARATAIALPDEPEAQLRAAAVEFASGETEDGLATLANACRGLRSLGRRCESDPLAFIMSEVELGSPGRATLGRIAAGIGLLWATSAETNHAYLRDDLMDDLSLAGWLAKRPSDVQLLQTVVGMLQREDAAGVPTMAKAA